MGQVVFKEGDAFFDPVSAFFASWLGYHSMHASQRHDVTSGRLRGKVVPQLTFDDDPTIGRLRKQEPIEIIRFEIEMSDPGEPKGKRVRSVRLMEFWCQQMFGHAYETARETMETKFGPDRKQAWPPALQFAYHIRNACFHANRFDIRPSAISTLVATEWRGRTIAYSNNNEEVAGGFFWPADFIVLLSDLQSVLA